MSNYKKRIDDIEGALEGDQKAMGMLLKNGMVNVIRNEFGQLRGDVWDGQKLSRPGWETIYPDEFIAKYGEDATLICINYTNDVTRPK